MSAELRRHLRDGHGQPSVPRSNVQVEAMHARLHRRWTRHHHDPGDPLAPNVGRIVAGRGAGPWTEADQ